jgi:hypothetical protein
LGSLRIEVILDGLLFCGRKFVVWISIPVLPLETIRPILDPSERDTVYMEAVSAISLVIVISDRDAVNPPISNDVRWEDQATSLSYGAEILQDGGRCAHDGLSPQPVYTGAGFDPRYEVRLSENPPMPHSDSGESFFSQQLINVGSIAPQERCGLV